MSQISIIGPKPTQPKQSLLSMLKPFWLAESIRLSEEKSGLLEDSEANRISRANGGDLQTRVLKRAEYLAQRDGLSDALNKLIDSARLALLVFILFALLAGSSLTASIVGDGSRPINLFWAVAGLLGLHLLMLLGWLILLILSNGQTPLGRLWLYLASKLAHNARSVQLIPVLMQFIARKQMGRWGLGLIIHGWWLLFLCSAFFALIVLFSFRRYGFVWETTLLPNEVFIYLSQILASIPSLIGFPVPGTKDIVAAIENSNLFVNNNEYFRQLWALWLIGVLLVWGLFPRLLCALSCYGLWCHHCLSLDLDLTLPGYSLIRERLIPSSERLGINDAAPDLDASSSSENQTTTGSGCWLVAIELDGSHPWPPALPADIFNAGIIDTGKQRRQLLDYFSQHPPEKLLIACDPRRSLDRGTIALINELSLLSMTTRIWLLPAPAGEELDRDRFDDWQQALDKLGMRHNEVSLEWLEDKDG